MPSFYGGIGITSGSGGGSGVSITNIEFDESRNLIIYLSNGSKKNLGPIDGAIFTPSIDENGILTWSNDKGLENPPAFDLKVETDPEEDQGEQWFPLDESTEEEQPTTTDQYVWEKI